MTFHLRDPFDPPDPPEPREHYEDCPALEVASEDDPSRDCTCAERDEVAYDDEMERRVDVLRDRE